MTVLERFVALGEIDSGRLLLLRSIQAKPEALADQRRRVETQRGRLARREEEVKRMAAEIRRLELEVEDRKEAQRKYAGQQLQAKTNEEYAALTSEIAKARAKIGEIEDQQLVHMEAQERARGELTALRGELKELEAALGRAEVAVERELGELRGELAELDARRAEAVQGLPLEHLDRYDHILERYRSVGVAALKDDICQGCYIQLVPNVLNRVLAAADLIHCPQCQRILYLKDGAR